jgi:hypothetical protein
MALVRRTDVLEEHIASIFRVKDSGVFPARSEDVPQDGQQRDPLVTAALQLCRSGILI